MKLTKLKISNIRSYENQEIDFPDGSILLSGDIGSGKTSILLGIEFALFGLQPGQRGNSLLRNGEKEGGVTLEFEVDDKEIIIERVLKKGKTISQDYCSITINGEKKELSVTELKNKVLDLLEYPREFSKKQNMLYKFTVYTPQEEMKQIILQDSETRINTLRHVFGIDKYKKILENVSIITSKIREEKRIKEGFILNLEQDKLDIFGKETEIESKHSNLISVEKEFFLRRLEREKIQKEKEEILKKIEEKAKVQQEIEKTQIMISSKKESISGNLRAIEQLKKQIEELGDIHFDELKITKLEQEITAIKKESEKFNEKNIEIHSQISSINMKNEEIKRMEKNISNLDICPTCLQDVDALYRANVLNKAHSDMSENKRKLESLADEKKQVYEKIKKIELEVYSKEKEIDGLILLKAKLHGVQDKKIRIEEMIKFNFSYEKDMGLLNRHVESLRNSSFELTRFDGIFEIKKKDLDEALRQERMAEIKFAELKKEIEGFARQIKELKLKVNRAEEIRKELNYLSQMESWLSKEFISVISFIEKNVMVRLKADFSRLFSEWFSMLVSDSFNVRLDDDFTPIVEQQDYEIDYSYLSGGERTAIALAYRLALNQVINSLISKIKTKDIVILDEPTDGFSEQQLDKMRDVLQQLTAKQLIIVSHEQKIEGFVGNVLRFKKENGISFIER